MLIGGHDRGPLAALAVGFLAVVLLTSCGANSVSPEPLSTPTQTSSSPSIEAPKAVEGSTAFTHKANVAFGGPAYVNGRPMLYLTYDDGPFPGKTDLVIDELQKANVTATFFVLGMYLQTPAERAVLKREYEMGYAIGVHGFTHGDMKKWRRVSVHRELGRIKPLISEITGAMPTCSRPPYGSLSNNVIGQNAKWNMRIQLWTADGAEFKNPSVASMYSQLRNQLKPGAVILMHDRDIDAARSAKVTRKLVAYAKTQGYDFGQICPMLSQDQTRAVLAGATPPNANR